MNLYKITEEHYAAIDVFCEASQQGAFEESSVATMEAWLNETRDNLDKKRLAVAAYIKNKQSDIDALKLAEDDLNDRRKRKQSQVDWLKKSLLESMIRTDTKAVESPEFDIKRRLNNPSVIVFDETLLPAIYTKLEEFRKIDKIAIADDIKAGISVPGAEMIRTESLQIK